MEHTKVEHENIEATTPPADNDPTQATPPPSKKDDTKS